jgi:predicted Fe-Mo cluster-binding NifX family protein
MSTLRLVVPTKGPQGIRDTLSDVFARAVTFTLIDVEDGVVKHVTVEENTASDLRQGTGPVVVKNLKEKGVDILIAGEVGPGAVTLLEMSGIRMIRVEPGIKVRDALTEALMQL